jgi:hypothetical protein
MGIAIMRLDGPTKGQVYIERDDLAEAMISTGQAERATFGQHNVSSPSAPETPESSKAVSAMSRAELEAEIERRGISIDTGSGKGGSILKRDLIDALT